ncbi:hypothetical protein BJX68DRAFT_27326 [Aspergillus pseudodeflectus]|uniref:DUF1746 domain-containing protein n=1 Tax=Aspergillus pseudodeflectus TaxID=176178 RepID=A0ABR4JAB1_9EURO
MTTPDVFRDAEYIADVSGITYGSITDISPTLHDERLRKKLQSAAKLALIDRLLRDLDILIYCELSALYYLDCSIVLFAIRAIVQLIFFTPKAPPFDPNRNQPFIGAIFASNLFCMTFHKFFSQPEAGEATRGYLHGGILIDFIGQKAPVPVARLLCLDFLVMLLNIVMLGLIVERVKVADSREPVAPNNTANAEAATTTAATQTEQTQAQTQDHDHEERGLQRHETPETSSTPPTEPSPSPSLSPRDQSQEPQQEQASPSRTPSNSNPEDPNLNPEVYTHTHTPTEEDLERTRLLADPSEHGTHTTHQHALDAFSSGDAVIMRMGLFNVIRDQWAYRPSTTRWSSAPSERTAALLRERFGLQVGADGRLERIPA